MGTVLDATIQTLRLVNRRTGEYAGPCPECQAGDDRFHVWTRAQGNRPAGRYWCRVCGTSGVIGDVPLPQADVLDSSARKAASHADLPTSEHIAYYRQIYELVALWAHRWLFEEANPEPLAYVCSRGLSEVDARRFLLGYGLHDPQALVEWLSDIAPDLMPYAQECGVLVRDQRGVLRTHWSLCGALIFPTFAEGAIVDLRARKPGAGQRGRSLPGSPLARGAAFPMGWSAIGESDTVILTESGEFKTLVPLAAYHQGLLDTPTLGFPGINGFQATLGQQLYTRGVRRVIIAYDSQPRLVINGQLALAPEERWSLIYGAQLQQAGLAVQVLRLPLASGQTKVDLDSFLLEQGPERLQCEIDQAVPLLEYHQSLPRSLLDDRIPVIGSYPTHRPRPQQIFEHPPPVKRPTSSISTDIARQQIRERVAEFAHDGQGMLALAHPPGVGKGHNTIQGLLEYRTTTAEPGFLVWTAARKNQQADQEGIDFIALQGRNPQNCRKYAEAQALSARGYQVREALCRQRCPFAGNCAYLRQFGQEGDYFAPQALLQATGWWQDASVLVLDEFDPGRLTQCVELSLSDLAAMQRASDCPHANAILRWTAVLLASTTERRLTGTLFYRELNAIAAGEGLSLSITLTAARAARPDPLAQACLRDAPRQLSMADYITLPPAYLDRLLTLYAQEWQRYTNGSCFTSRVEARDGLLFLALRHEHVIAQLANPTRPTIVLDATAQLPLLRALFPNQPIACEQPQVGEPPHTIQVLGQDWAKTTLQGERQERWFDEVSRYIRPDRQTLVVTTLECAPAMRAALLQRGHDPVLVRVGHYGGLRGSNAYQGYDVLLAQVYHPNLEAVLREGRALFADDVQPLNERMICEECTLSDASGAGHKRLVRDIFHISGRLIRNTRGQIVQIVLNQAAPRVRAIVRALEMLLRPVRLDVNWGET